MINHFTFNGTSTAQLGLIVSGVSIFGAGSRKVEKAGIPGRNGDLQIELGGFNNYTVRYTVSITNNFTTTAQQIREWLLESKGYCDLTDTYHPDEIRKACFNSDIEFTTSMLYKYGQASIQFDCLPERYLTTNTPITTTATADTTTDTTLSLSTVPTPITISLNGNTTQEGTPTPTNPQEIHNVSGDNTIHIASKNLLSNDWENDWQRGYWDISTGKFVSNRNWQAIKYYIPVKPNTTYYVYADPNISASIGNICQYDANKNFIVYKAGAKNTTFTTSANVYFLTIYVGNPYKNTNISLTESDTTTNGTYVPFTAQSYPIYLPVENLFDFSTLANLGTDVTEIENGYSFTVSGTQYSTGAPISVNSGMLYVKCKIKNVTGKNLRVRVGYTDSTYNEAEGSGQSITGEWFNFSMTTNASKTVNKILFNWSTRGIFEVKDFMVSYHNTVNYYPYGTTPIELNKIGTYQDYIYKNGGKWYLHKEFNKVDLGTLTWTYNTTGRVFYATLNPAPPIHTNTTKADAYCSKYPITTWSDKTDKSAQIFYAFVNGINIEDETYTDARTFKNSISGTELVYRIATPTNTEITDTTLINQLNNIEKAYSYNGTTNILQVSNDNGFMLSVVSLHGSTFNSNYKGEPIITVNATGLIYLNGEVMEVLSAPVTINCQTMQCYNGVVNMNNEVRVNDFPEIKIGANEVGSSMALTITPNNWRH